MTSTLREGYQYQGVSCRSGRLALFYFPSYISSSYLKSNPNPRMDSQCLKCIRVKTINFNQPMEPERRLGETDFLMHQKLCKAGRSCFGLIRFQCFNYKWKDKLLWTQPLHLTFNELTWSSHPTVSLPELANFHQCPNPSLKKIKVSGLVG